MELPMGFSMGFNGTGGFSNVKIFAEQLGLWDPAAKIRLVAAVDPPAEKKAVIFRGEMVNPCESI